jgi:hypothetical protein
MTDLGLELRHLPVKVLQCNLHDGQAVIGLAMLRLRCLELLLLGQVLGPVLDAAQLGVELREFEQ